MVGLCVTWWLSRAARPRSSNHILSNQKGVRKWLVIVNEIGEVGIDNELVVTTSDERWSLQYGWLCCSTHGEGARAGLSAFWKRLIRGISSWWETTDLADRYQVALTFWLVSFADLLR